MINADWWMQQSIAEQQFWCWKMYVYLPQTGDFCVAMFEIYYGSQTLVTPGGFKL